MAPAARNAPAAAARRVIPADTALLIIDVQQGMDAPFLPERNNPGAERQMTALLAAWRTAGAPVIHVQHLSVHPDSPLRPGQPGVELKPEVRPLPGEPLFQKRVNSAFIGTALEDHLRERRIARLVIVGLTTDHCVSSTARTAANLGFGVTVVSDATATFGRNGPDGRYYGPDEIHRAELAILHGEFAAVLSTEAVLTGAATTG
jgi:nicotinamidase-related amidase